MRRATFSGAPADGRSVEAHALARQNLAVALGILVVTCRLARRC